MDLEYVEEYLIKHAEREVELVTEEQLIKWLRNKFWELNQIQQALNKEYPDSSVFRS